jgi:hypothetical protein
MLRAEDTWDCHCAGQLWLSLFSWSIAGADARMECMPDQPSTGVDGIRCAGHAPSLLTLVCAAEQMTKRTMDMLYVRGDGVILVSPPLRTS